MGCPACDYPGTQQRLGRGLALDLDGGTSREMLWAQPLLFSLPR